MFGRMFKALTSSKSTPPKPVEPVAITQRSSAVFDFNENTNAQTQQTESIVSFSDKDTESVDMDNPMLNR